MLFDSNFLFRIAVSGAVALIGLVLFYLNFLTFPKDFLSWDKKTSVLLAKKTSHWTNTCQIIGFLALTGDPNNMQEVWTLPLFLRSCLDFGLSISS